MLCHYWLLAACVIRGEGITRVYLPSDAPAFYINKCTSVSSMASNTKAGIVSRLRCSEANHLNLGPHLLHSALSSPSNMFPLALCFPVLTGPTAGTCRAVGDRTPLCAASWGLSAWSQLFSPHIFPWSLSALASKAPAGSPAGCRLQLTGTASDKEGQAAARRDPARGRWQTALSCS